MEMKMQTPKTKKISEKGIMLLLIERLHLIEHIMSKYETTASPQGILDRFTYAYKNKLNENEREILCRHYIGGEPIQDVGGHLGLAPSTAYNTYTKARRLLLCEENIEFICPETIRDSIKRCTRKNREKFIENDMLTNASILTLSLSAIELPEKYKNGLREADIRTVGQLTDLVLKRPNTWSDHMPRMDAMGKKLIESVLYGLGVIAKKKRSSGYSEPIARIMYLNNKDEVDETMDYHSMEAYKDDLVEAICYGKKFRSLQYREEAKRIYKQCMEKYAT